MSRFRYGDTRRVWKGEEEARSGGEEYEETMERIRERAKRREVLRDRFAGSSWDVERYMCLSWKDMGEGVIGRRFVWYGV
jgi:hypothetical protein